MIPCSPIVTIQKGGCEASSFLFSSKSSKASFQIFQKIKKRTMCAFLHLSAGKVVHSSNQFAADLEAILEFIDKDRHTMDCFF